MAKAIRNAIAVFVLGASGAWAQELVQRYCVGCHSTAAKAGGLVLQDLDPSHAADQPDIWEKVIRRVSAGEMPPKGMPRPDAAAAGAFTKALTEQLDASAEHRPFAGRPVIRRLNRTEYGNAIHDLLALDTSVSSQLPQDGLAAGFDNIGDALSLSPVLLEQYLKLARKNSYLATGTGESSPVTTSYTSTGPQSVWQGEDMPFGTRGGASVHHYFARDGEYSLRAFLLGGDRLSTADDVRAMSPTEGVRFFQTKIPVKAGAHTFVATFPDDYAEREGPTLNPSGLGGAALGGPVDAQGSAIRPAIDFLLDGKPVKRFEIKGPYPGEAAAYVTGPPILEKVEISGPYNPTGIAETPSRERIFVCRPGQGVTESACAAKIVNTLARRAFRRDVTTADTKPYMDAWRAARLKGNFDEATAAALRRILVAPDFLFRLETDPAGAAPGSVAPVGDFELASRLSFFLWSSIPDDELLNCASRGQLKNPAVLKQQVTRMLADPRAEALVGNFAVQWLGLRAAAEALPDPAAFPEYDAALSDAFQKETQLFVRSVIRENHSILDLIDADYTFVNERLAKFYGIPGVTGPGFRRVSKLEGTERGGILGQGAILVMTSHPNRTSPVLRGNWILTNLLNSPPPPPPPGVPPLDLSPVNGKPLTTRQQVERHRASATCSSCHSRIDPLGFALENFDPIGRWRTRDAGGDIDPSGQLSSGEEIAGPQGLRKYLLNHRDRFVGAIEARLMTFALGRQLESRDQPAIRKVVRDAEAQGYKFSDLILGTVVSVPFRMRQIQENKD
jgi:hypothetical protein